MPRKYHYARRHHLRPLLCASMRPGRMPRKYRPKQCILSSLASCFNEAGADAPEIPMPLLTQ